MNIVFKTPEELQAQAEIFADSGVKDFSEAQKLLLHHSRWLSGLLDLHDEALAALPTDKAELVREHRRSYAGSVASMDPDEVARIAANTLLYQEKFAPAITKLKGRIAEIANPKFLPEYLGSGSRGSAFRIEVDSVSYAAKFSSSVVQSHFEIKPLLRAAGIPRTAQLTTYSYEDEVVIMPLLPGIDVTNTPPESTLEYPEEHIVDLIETARALHGRGINIDPKPSNFMYDPKAGFSILDFHLAEKYLASEGTQIMYLHHALCARKWPQSDYSSPTYFEHEYPKEEYAKNVVFLPTMVRFISILQRRYPHILTEWHETQAKFKADPKVRVTPIVNREYIGDYPEFKPYLDELAEMGF